MSHGLDLGALLAALDAKRLERHLSWRGVALAAKVNPQVIGRMNAYGGKPSADALCAFIHWLGSPNLQAFTRELGEEETPDGNQ